MLTWNKTSEMEPGEQGSYLGCWRTPFIPREGSQRIEMDKFFYRKADRKWFRNAISVEPPEYWARYNLPNFNKED